MSEQRPEKQGFFDVHRTVFGTSAVLILFFVVYTLINLGQMGDVFSNVQDFFASSAGWFYIVAVNIYLAITVYLYFSPYGGIRLGGDDARPEFSYFGWFSMLFAAGMGIGIMFYSVAEPISHYSSPPWGDPETPESAELSMAVTFFHWGIHTWGLYALMALGLAFFCFRHALPLTVRAVFYPLLGERIYGWPGNLVDILATVSTVFGLATSLGLGAMQVNAGLNFVAGVPNESWVQVILIAIIASIALISVVLGLDRGIRRLSVFNMGVALTLLLFMLFAGPTIHLIEAFVQNIGTYITHLPKLSFWTESYTHRPSSSGESWQNSWTLFYWAWWIAWAPFVGVFVARISYGRTIREFVATVLLVPTLLSFFWMTIFGNAALSLELSEASAGLVDAVQNDLATALFVLLENYPVAALTSFLAIVVVTVFFVTSSDSASLVVVYLTSGGNMTPPVSQRVFWATLQGVVAAVLLLGGGEDALQALQTAVITTGLPFAVVLLILGYSLLKGLRQERAQADRTLGGSA